MKALDHHLESEVNASLDFARENPDPLLTAEEVAHYLRLKPETIRAMARRGELPAVKVGRVWRFSQSSLRKIVEEITTIHTE